MNLDFPGGWDGKAFYLQCGRPRFHLWVRKILWRRKWQPTPVFLPGKSHAWRSMVGYRPRGPKELDTTEWLHFHFLSRWILIHIHVWERLLFLCVILNGCSCILFCWYITNCLMIFLDCFLFFSVTLIVALNIVLYTLLYTCVYKIYAKNRTAVNIFYI